MNESSPAISFDVALKDSVEFIDVDYDALVSYMQSRGLSDESISATSIAIHSGRLRYVDASRNKRTKQVLNGYYEKERDSISLYPVNDLVVAITQKTLQDRQTTGPQDSATVAEVTMAEVAAETGKSLAHEIEHKVLAADKRIARQERAYALKENTKQLGATTLVLTAASTAIFTSPEVLEYSVSPFAQGGACVALAIAATTYLCRPSARRRLYRNSPEEIRCRSVEAEAPATIISIEFNEQSIQDAKKASSRAVQ